jgi:hypothetical protein
MYAGIGALAALPKPLRELVPNAHRFRVAAGCAFPGYEHYAYLARPMQPRTLENRNGTADRFAYRLAATLNTHGPALISTLLSPSYGLSQAKRRPEILDSLRSSSTGLSNVPQAPLVQSGACASALLALAQIAPQLVAQAYPGAQTPALVLWTAADAALQSDRRIVEGFGVQALASSVKLAQLNGGRDANLSRRVAEALAPFDEEALGTVIGNAGSGLVVTTLEFAVENFLDVSSLIVGWGQSAETGGKAHFAGVGFGGENALMHALYMAQEAHGYGVESFRHVVAHATGTRVNSQTDLASIAQARQCVAAQQNARHGLPTLTVSAPKALGDGHTMGECGLRATAEAIYYVLGEKCAGIPSLRRLDPALERVGEQFSFSREAIPGNDDGGALVATQGFGGYNAAVALRSANPDTLRRYRFSDPKKLDAYLERRFATRREREKREQAARLTRHSVLQLIERHRWV